MVRFFSRFWAKRKYIWHQEGEAAMNDLNAAISLQRAADKRDLIVQLNKEADDIEKNIREVAARWKKVISCVRTAMTPITPTMLA
jgi:hypothetical protein